MGRLLVNHWELMVHADCRILQRRFEPKFGRDVCAFDHQPVKVSVDLLKYLCSLFALQRPTASCSLCPRPASTLKVC